MRVFFKQIDVSTRGRAELIDLTSLVEENVRRSGVERGLCLVHSLHSTTAIVVNEHEGGLMRDILAKVGEEFPRGAGWLHDRVDDNADAHLASSLIGSSRVFPVQSGRLIRGAWQNIFLLELDGPRDRKIVVEVLGD
ncbi:MAG: secondary thiamine-phosphate synthase enzyme YjbQ [Candidatus Geothermarchaeales archaeon]